MASEPLGAPGGPGCLRASPPRAEEVWFWGFVCASPPSHLFLLFCWKAAASSPLGWAAFFSPALGFLGWVVFFPSPPCRNSHSAWQPGCSLRRGRPRAPIPFSPARRKPSSLSNKMVKDAAGILGAGGLAGMRGQCSGKLLPASRLSSSPLPGALCPLLLGGPQAGSGASLGLPLLGRASRRVFFPSLA